MACLENHQNAAGNTYHHTGNGSLGEALRHFLGYFHWIPAHDETAYKSHQEYCAQFRKIPSLGFRSPHDHNNTGNEWLTPVFPDPKRFVFDMIRIHGKAAEIITVNKAFAGSAWIFNAYRITKKEATAIRDDMTDNPVTGARHLGHRQYSAPCRP